MISGHESGMFPDSIFLLVEDECVEDCIEELDKVLWTHTVWLVEKQRPGVSYESSDYR